jgi:hypothetical protein
MNKCRLTSLIRLSHLAPEIVGALAVTSFLIELSSDFVGRLRMVTAIRGCFIFVRSSTCICRDVVPCVSRKQAGPFSRSAKVGS